MSSIPGPPPTPLLGWRPHVARFFRDPIAAMQRLRAAYGDVVCLVRGGNPPLVLAPGSDANGGTDRSVFVFGPDNHRAVLAESRIFESDKVRAPAQCPWLGDNMVAANRRERALERRMMTGALTRDHLRSYYRDMVSLSEAMLDGWAPGDTVDVSAAAEDLAADVASKAFYGEEPRPGRQTLAGVARRTAKALFSPISMVPINFPGSPYRRFLGLARQAESMVLDAISRKREEGLGADDVLSMMIREHDEGELQLSDTHLVGNAFTLFLAGHDVPANALSFTLFLLAQHPETAAELDAELDAELGGGAPAFEQLWKGLPVLDAIIRESLRVLTPALFVWRRLTAPAKVGGHELPVGCEVLVSPYITHTDPAVFARPRRFLPERWSAAKPSPFEYFPFSYGARKCLGAAYAEMFLKIVTSLVYQRCRLESPEGRRIDLAMSFTMKPKGGLPMRVHPRDRDFHASKRNFGGRMRQLLELS